LRIVRCGFSQKIIGILEKEGLDYTTYDILTDDGVRQSAFPIPRISSWRLSTDLELGVELKTMNEWPTFPQLIIKGEFVGGLDVVKEMVDNGELQEMMSG
jgi:glutaredoxin-related protein